MNEQDYHVAVIGGGPAGSSAAAQLASRGLRVLLLEKASMPRDTLCGEFLSTEVAGMCGRLGVLEEMRSDGARRLNQLELTESSGGVVSIALPGSAMSLSRRRFDYLLFRRAGSSGADVRDGEAVRGVQGCLQDGFRVETSEREVTAAVVLGAYGRRSALDRRLDRTSLERRSPYVAFKARHRGAFLAEVVELHAFDGGYCGLVGDENGDVNVCWLSRADRLRQAGGSPDAMIEHVLCENPHLRRRFAALSRTGGFLAVGQLSFRPKDPFASDVCMIGDAAGMIAPLCGDGMGMALRSAEMAVPLVDAYLAGALGPAALRGRYRRAWMREFSRRMQFGRALNEVFTHPIPGRFALELARRIPAAARFALAATRG